MRLIVEWADSVLTILFSHFEGQSKGLEWTFFKWKKEIFNFLLYSQPNSYLRVRFASNSVSPMKIKFSLQISTIFIRPAQKVWQLMWKIKSTKRNFTWMKVYLLWNVLSFVVTMKALHNFSLKWVANQWFYNDFWNNIESSQRFISVSFSREKFQHN